MKNKWLVLGTLLGVALGAGILYFGVKKYMETHKSEPKEGGTGLTNMQIRRLIRNNK